MQELILNQNGRLLTTSRIVADEFKKKHQHVLEAINKIDQSKSRHIFFQENFNASTYEDSYKRNQKEYHITEKGFMLLVMSFSGKKADNAKINFIDAFTEMKEQLQANKIDPNNITRLDIAKMLVESEQERILLQSENERLTPLAEAVQILKETNDEISISAFASLIGVGRNKLYQTLREDGKLIPKGERYNTPYQQYLNHGYFRVIEKTHTTKSGAVKISLQTFITGKGQVWIYKGLKSKGFQLQPLVGMEAVV